MENLYLKNTLKFDSSKCTGCAICENVCPHGVFVIDNRKAKLINKTACMECGACEKNCQFNAIKVTKGTGCGFGMIYEAVTGKDIGAGLHYVMDE